MDPAFPLTWRLQREHAGSGALGDLGAHIVDLAQYLTGELITGVSAASHHLRWRAPPAAGRPGAPGPVTVDDAALFTARLRPGHAGLVRGDPVRGRPQERAAHRAERRTRQPGIRPGAAERAGVLRPDRGRGRRPGSAASWSPSPATRTCPAWWPPGHVLGWEHTFTHQAPDLVTAISAGRTRRRRSPTACRCSGCWPRWQDSADAWVPVDGGLRRTNTALKPGTKEPIMSRPFTLFTGQWADLPLEEVCAAGPRLGLRRPRARLLGRSLRGGPGAGRGRLPGRAARAAGEVRAALLGHLQPPGRPGGLRPPDRRSGTRPSCPPGSGATASRKASGSGRPPKWPTPRGPRPRSGCRPWSASPARRSGTRWPCSRRCRGP